MKTRSNANRPERTESGSGYLMILMVLFGFLSGTAFTQTAFFDQKPPFTQEPLPYAYNALEPVVDSLTMVIHYTKHHAGYVKNLNEAVKGTPYADWTLVALVSKASKTTDAIRNNAGGHFNHTLFWAILATDKPFSPESEIGKAVVGEFGSVDNLKTELKKAGATRFGSGWAWLILTPEKRLVVTSTPNQDNPLMDVAEVRGIPLLGIDVWEHAYYLKYQNRRGDYLAGLIDAINWEVVNDNYKKALERVEKGWK